MRRSFVIFALFATGVVIACHWTRSLPSESRSSAARPAPGPEIAPPEERREGGIELLSAAQACVHLEVSVWREDKPAVGAHVIAGGSERIERMANTDDRGRVEFDFIPGNYLIFASDDDHRRAAALVHLESAKSQGIRLDLKPTATLRVTLDGVPETLSPKTRESCSAGSPGFRNRARRS